MSKKLEPRYEGNQEKIFRLLRGCISPVMTIAAGESRSEWEWIQTFNPASLGKHFWWGDCQKRPEWFEDITPQPKPIVTLEDAYAAEHERMMKTVWQDGIRRQGESNNFGMT
jgi:hypothetical protein